jgi:hypothetical protein
MTQVAQSLSGFVRTYGTSLTLRHLDSNQHGRRRTERCGEAEVDNRGGGGGVYAVAAVAAVGGVHIATIQGERRNSSVTRAHSGRLG